MPKVASPEVETARDAAMAQLDLIDNIEDKSRRLMEMVVGSFDTLRDDPRRILTRLRQKYERAAVALSTRNGHRDAMTSSDPLVVFETDGSGLSVSWISTPGRDSDGKFQPKDSSPSVKFTWADLEAYLQGR